MNLQEAIARPGIAKLDYEATTFSFSPDPDDPFTVFWDVTDIAKRLAALDTKVIPLPLEGLDPWFEENRIEIDRTHAMSMRVDPRVPILAIYFDDGILPVDGWHRIVRHDNRGGIPGSAGMYLENMYMG